MNNWIDIQTAHIIREHAEDLKNRIESLSNNSSSKKLNEIYAEIILDFSDNYYADACLKINLIAKMILNSQLDDIEKYKSTDIEDINLIIELSLGLQNALAIQKSLAIQKLIAKENPNG